MLRHSVQWQFQALYKLKYQSVNLNFTTKASFKFLFLFLSGICVILFSYHNPLSKLYPVLHRRLSLIFYWASLGNKKQCGVNESTKKSNDKFILLFCNQTEIEGRQLVCHYLIIRGRSKVD